MIISKKHVESKGRLISDTDHFNDYNSMHNNKYSLFWRTLATKVNRSSLIDKSVSLHVAAETILMKMIVPAGVEGGNVAWVLWFIGADGQGS